MKRIDVMRNALQLESLTDKEWDAVNNIIEDVENNELTYEMFVANPVIIQALKTMIKNQEKIETMDFLIHEVTDYEKKCQNIKYSIDLLF